MTYRNTFIKVAADCPVDQGEIPVSKTDKRPAHGIQYDLLTAQPYVYDQEELIYQVFIRQKELPEGLSPLDAAQIREDLFSKGQPCLRASALTKRYGFGAHYNELGKIAIYPLESAEYERFLSDPEVKVLPAMRNKR